MAQRLDIDATREALIAGWLSMAAPPGTDERELARLARLKRGAKMCAEIVCFSLAEMERVGADDDVLPALIGIADVMGHAIHYITNDITQDGDTEHIAEHTAIHVFVDALGRTMHQMHYAVHDPDSSDAKLTEPIHVQLVRKTLADA